MPDAQQDARVPNLILAGAAKSGTTSLHHYLGSHPDIFMNPTKEPHFFCRTRNSGEREAYLQGFADGRDVAYRGESSTGYMTFAGSADRMAAASPGCKVIFLLRNPVDRIRSHYAWKVGLGEERRAFWDAVEADWAVEPDHARKPEGHLGYFQYFQWGLYGKWLQRFLGVFPREQLFVMTTEALEENPQASMDQLFMFLGLDRPNNVDFSKRHNRSAVYRLPLVSKLERMRWSRWIPAYDRLPSPIHAQLERAKSRLFERMPKTSVDFVLQPQDRRRLASAYEQDVISLRAAVGLSFEDWTDFAVAL